MTELRRFLRGRSLPAAVSVTLGGLIAAGGIALTLFSLKSWSPEGLISSVGGAFAASGALTALAARAVTRASDASDRHVLAEIQLHYATLRYQQAMGNVALCTETGAPSEIVEACRAEAFDARCDLDSLLQASIAAGKAAAAAESFRPSVLLRSSLRAFAPRRVAEGLTFFAASLAGPGRTAVRDEWRAHLVGAPEDGVALSASARLRYAAGFVVAGIRYRLHDMAVPAWKPVDWLLVVDSRVNAVVASAVGAQVIYIAHGDGIHALLTEGWGWCAGCGVALRLLCGWLRRARGIEIASPGRPPTE